MLEAFRSSFEQLIIPSFEAATQRMFDQIGQAVEQGVAQSVAMNMQNMPGGGGGGVNGSPAPAVKTVTPEEEIEVRVSCIVYRACACACACACVRPPSAAFVVNVGGTQTH